MASLAAGSAAGAAMVGAGLFQYNRDNYLYDRDLRQETEYNIQEFRIMQAQLWREDVRDIIEMTSVKMDTYLIVIAVELGMVVMALCEGRMQAGTPRELMGCYMLSLGGAFIYLLISLWFAMHASVTSKSYKNRLLTQYVRLPMPTWSQVEASRTYASSFESLQSDQMFRVPFLMERWRGPTGSNAEDEPEGGKRANDRCSKGSADPWGLEAQGDQIYELDGKIRADHQALSHLRLVQQAIPYWQSWDAFARASLSVGTIQLTNALSYYVLAYVVLANLDVCSGTLVVVLLLFTTTFLVRMDMSLTCLEAILTIALQIAGPIIQTIVCCRMVLLDFKKEPLIDYLAIIAFITNALYFAFLLKTSKVDWQGSNESVNVYLPTGFRSVMYIDVFGWIKGRRSKAMGGEQAQESNAANTASMFEWSSCNLDPAAMHFDKKGYAVPTRPEGESGATAPPMRLKSEHMEPASFVPLAKGEPTHVRKDSWHSTQAAMWEPLAPGERPWTIFSRGTILLIALWAAVGFTELVEEMGFRSLIVSPMLEEPETIQEAVDTIAEPAKQHLHEIGFLALGFKQLAGERLHTAWPGGGHRVHSLSCGGDGHVVAASHFGLFSAKIPKRDSTPSVLRGSTVSAPVSFTAAPDCAALAGKAIQDVSVVCNGNETAQATSCTALVLLRGERELVRCKITDTEKARGLESGENDRLLLGEALDDGSGTEAFVSLTTTGACHGSRRVRTNSSICGYAATSRGPRVLELRELDSAGNRQWVAAHSIDLTSQATPDQIGSLSVVNGKVLFFQPGSRRLSLLQKDPLEARRLAKRKSSAWFLPMEHRWVGVCGSESDGLLAITDSDEPEVFRFSVPEELTRQKEKPTNVPVFKHRFRSLLGRGERGGPGGRLDPSVDFQ